MMVRNIGCWCAVWSILAISQSIHAEERKLRSSLLESNPIGRIEIVAGRISATRFPYSYSCQRSSKPKSSRHQSLSITARKGSVTARYQGDLGGSRITFELLPNGIVRFHERVLARGGSYEELEYRQTQKGVRLTVRYADHDLHYLARNLWELVLTRRILTKATLIPALHRLQSRWNVDLRATEIERRLFVVAKSRRWQPIDRGILANLVTNLADKKFPIRQAAHRKLVSYGQMLLPFLTDLDDVALDREQKMRLKEIRHGLMNGESDLSDRVAIWLSGSRSIWLSLLDHPKLNNRIVARTQLSRILGEPISFDPSAESKQRRMQVNVLRKKYDARSIASERRRKIK